MYPWIVVAVKLNGNNTLSMLLSWWPLLHGRVWMSLSSVCMKCYFGLTNWGNWMSWECSIFVNNKYSPRNVPIVSRVSHNLLRFAKSPLKDSEAEKGFPSEWSHDKISPAVSTQVSMIWQHLIPAIHIFGLIKVSIHEYWIIAQFHSCMRFYFYFTIQFVLLINPVISWLILAFPA